MTPQDGPISIPPTHRIEELFVALLQEDADLSGLPIVAASNRDALVPPLHCFVFCNRAAPVLNVGQNYRAEVVIVIASNIDDNDHAARKGWTTKVNHALTRREPGYTPPGGRHEALLIGWSIEDLRETSEGQMTGDTISLRVAAYVAG